MDYRKDKDGLAGKPDVSVTVEKYFCQSHNVGVIVVLLEDLFVKFR